MGALAVRSAEEAYAEEDTKVFKAQRDRDVKTLKEGLRVLERNFAYTNAIPAKGKAWGADL